LVRLEDLVKDVKMTEILYWQDSYAKTFQGSMLRLEPDDKGHAYIILDRTVFHPKSGGQPSDKGKIIGMDFELEVKKAMLNGGIVIHWAKVRNGEPKLSQVVGEVNWDLRYLLMRRHTAAHLYDHCLANATGKRVETTDSWLGDECYVGYKGKVPSTNQLQEAEKMANRMIKAGASVHVSTISHDELIRSVPDAPNIFRLPRFDSYRIVEIEDCKPIPCGGTHLRNISEIGKFTLKSAETSDLGFRVHYDVNEI